MAKKIDAPRAWAWEFPKDIEGTSHVLCSWAESEKVRLKYGTPTDDCRAVRVRIIREADYQKLVRAAK